MARGGGSQRRQGSPIVRLACADDDAQGQSLDVLWDYELDRRSSRTRAGTTSRPRASTRPRQFAAYLHTLRWNCVTATDPNLFQSPFRAGIKIDAYQIEPLRKALRLPRVNLFIADDVGLGKTIEAGLIARELLLRKKAKTIVVAAPPSVLAQWKDELEERFGLVFEILDRDYVTRDAPRARLRRQPLAHAHPLPRLAPPADRRAYADPMRDWLGRLLPGSLLILDEAHHAAPVERRPLRHRLEVHPRGPRPRQPLRAPAVPLGHAAQRPLEQLLGPARAPRPVALLPRRAGARQEGARRRDGPPAQGGHPRGRRAGSPSGIVERIDIDGLPARRARARALAAARRVPDRARGALREHVEPQRRPPPGCSSSGCSSGCSRRSRRSPAASRSTGRPSSGSGRSRRQRPTLDSEDERRAAHFTTAPDADDERASAHGRGARGRGGVRRSRPSPRRRRRRRSATTPPRRRCGAASRTLLDQMQEIAEEHAALPGREDPPPHRLDPREPLPGPSAVRQGAGWRRRRSGTTAAS